MSTVRFLLGAKPGDDADEVIGRVAMLPAWRPFDARVVAFVARFAQGMLLHPGIRQFPELAALSHWFRGARLKEFAKHYPDDTNEGLVVGRGLAFHLAPANVDSIFMYSWLISLLAGNTNIVRVSQKASAQLEFLIEVLQETFAAKEGAAIAGRVVILTYPHDATITQQISSRCMVRVVWGGDETVATIRSVPLRATAEEFCFPDRFSLAAIESDSIVSASDVDLERLAAGFYNDAFWFAQQACSSPRLLYWVGDGARCEMAKRRFWSAVEREISKRNPENSPAMSMTRLGTAFEFAASALAHPAESGNIGRMPTRLVLEVPLEGNARAIHCGNGLFLEDRIDTLDALAGAMTDKEQTLSVHGFSREDIVKLVRALPPRAVDRIVPIGDALTFSHVWDGKDLFVSFTRRISIP